MWKTTLAFRGHAHLVVGIDLEGNIKGVSVGIHFVGCRKKSSTFTFVDQIPAKEVCIDAERLYEALAGENERSAVMVKNLTARQISEEGILHIHWVSNDRESDVLMVLTFHKHILQIRVPYIELEPFIE